MKLLLALFLTIPAVILAKDVKCPRGFFHVKRTPTARNNQTKDWCLGAFALVNMADRDRARSACIFLNASLSIPENKAELDLIIGKSNISAPFATDGQVTPRCKAVIITHLARRLWYDTKTVKGDCNIMKNLFAFDDANTDPAFVLSHFKYGVPHGMITSGRTHEPEVRRINECIGMEEEDGGNYFNVVNCAGRLYENKSKEEPGSGYLPESIVDAVLCGRAPI